MKKILTIICVLFPALIFAQKYEIAASGGFNYCSTPSVYFSPVFSRYYLSHGNGEQGYAFSLSAAKNMKSAKSGSDGKIRSVWQLGVKIDVEQVVASGYWFNDGPFPHNYIPLNSIWIHRQTVHLAEPAIAPVLLLNRRSAFRKSVLYYGINAGGVYTFNQKKKYSADAVYMPSGGIGYTLGLQVGYSHAIYRGLSISADIAPHYYSVYHTTDRVQNPFGLKKWADITIPVTLGLKYSFGKYRN